MQRLSRRVKTAPSGELIATVLALVGAITCVWRRSQHRRTRAETEVVQWQSRPSGAKRNIRDRMCLATC